MALSSVVEALDVGKDTTLCLAAGQILVLVHQFSLECGKEALDGGVVVTVAGMAHARLNLIAVE